MFRKKTLKLRLPLSKEATLYAKVGDSLEDLLVYEIDQLEVLEEVKFGNRKVEFEAKDGQYISKGDILFTEGFMGHKAMVSDFGGILEIQDGVCRILGQKRHIERKINFKGKVSRIVPGKSVLLECEVVKFRPPFFSNNKKVLSQKIYLESKKEIKDGNIKFPSHDITYFVNDNLYVDDLAKLIAFGAKRIIVNAMFIEDYKTFYREVSKLDSFAIISGFGELTGRRVLLKEGGDKDIYWGEKGIYLADPLVHAPNRIFEHPFWGMAGHVKPKNEIVGELDYNGEVIEVYLKNVEHYAER